MVHLVAHPRKSQNVDVNKDDVAGSANITNLADYVTSIERKFNEDGTDDITKLSILKNRHTGKNVSIELKYDDIRHRFYSSSMMEELNVNYLDDRFQQINIDDSDLPFQEGIMISKELENKKKEYYKLYDRFVKADNWFKTQDNDYFESIEGKKEYRAFKEIINKLNALYNEIEAINQLLFILYKMSKFV